MTEELKQVVVEEQIDIALVEKAYEVLSQIFSKHLENAMQDAGNYLIKEFYNNDIKLARDKKSPKDESLNQLIQRLQNRSSDSPSKSWIYQSIKLVIQSHDIEKDDKKFFQTFGKITLSHKLSLLPITNMKTKKDLISKVIRDNLSVRDLEALKTELEIPSERKISLLTLLNDPEKIISSEASEILTVESLKKEPLNKLNKYKDKTVNKCEEFKDQLETFQGEIKKHQSYIKQYEKLISDIDKAVKTRKPAKKGRKKKS